MLIHLVGFMDVVMRGVIHRLEYRLREQVAPTQATHSRVDHAIKTLEMRLTKQSFIF